MTGNNLILFFILSYLFHPMRRVGFFFRFPADKRSKTEEIPPTEILEPTSSGNRSWNQVVMCHSSFLLTLLRNDTRFMTLWGKMLFHIRTLYSILSLLRQSSQLETIHRHVLSTSLLQEPQGFNQ